MVRDNSLSITLFPNGLVAQANRSRPMARCCSEWGFVPGVNVLPPSAFPIVAGLAGFTDSLAG